MSKTMKKDELREWMNTYHDKYIVAHNKLNEIKRVLEGKEYDINEKE